jgi:diacylglycerol O-acyltransferase / wax synthase
MKRLTGADATFLYMQTPNSYSEIAACILVDARGLPTGEELVAHSLAWLEPRLHLAPHMRRKLVRVPFELDHPVWIEDPGFDLEYHVRHAALPAPGSLNQLGDLVGRLLSRPLDHSRPLWELYVIEGVEGNQVAHFLKTHHAAVDGVAAFSLVASFVDLAPDAPPPPPPEEPWEPETVPSDTELVGRAMVNLARQPLRGLKAVRRLARSMYRAQTRHGDAMAGLVQSGVPPTRFNEPIGPHRRVRYLDLPLDEVKAAKVASGTKLNDIVLAVVAGGLRRYLDRHGELPDEPLVAFVPVSGRGGDSSGIEGNQTSMVHVELATDEADAASRLKRIAAASSEAKARHDDLGPSVFVDLTEFGGPALANASLRLMETMRLAERTRFGGNVVVSNIPGPSFPLYTAGAPITRLYPMGPVVQGGGLNITLLSYLDNLGFSIVTDRDLVPDLDDLVRDLQDSFHELAAAVGH